MTVFYFAHKNDLPQEMKRAMARQAVAERERRSKIIDSLGEFESAQKLSEAAHIMVENPITIYLRYLSTLAEIAVEHNTMTIFSFPVEMLWLFKQSTT